MTYSEFRILVSLPVGTRASMPGGNICCIACQFLPATSICFSELCLLPYSVPAVSRIYVGLSSCGYASAIRSAIASDEEFSYLRDPLILGSLDLFAWRCSFCSLWSFSFSIRCSRRRTRWNRRTREWTAAAVSIVLSALIVCAAVSVILGTSIFVSDLTSVHAFFSCSNAYRLAIA